MREEKAPTDSQPAGAKPPEGSREGSDAVWALRAVATTLARCLAQLAQRFADEADRRRM